MISLVLEAILQWPSLEFHLTPGLSLLELFYGGPFLISDLFVDSKAQPLSIFASRLSEPHQAIRVCVVETAQAIGRIR